jgi:hypothetical protein
MTVSPSRHMLTMGWMDPMALPTASAAAFERDELRDLGGVVGVGMA